MAVASATASTKCRNGPCRSIAPPFREQACQGRAHVRDERLIAKFKTDSAAEGDCRFALSREGVLPRKGNASFGIQAIIKSEVWLVKQKISKSCQCHPKLPISSGGGFSARIDRYEWLVNTAV